MVLLGVAGLFDVPNRKRVGLTSICHGLNELYGLVLPPVLPLLVSDFDITYTEAGLLLTVFYAMYAVFQLPAGILADRIGKARLMIFGLFGLAACVLFASLAQSYAMLIGVQILAGIAGSTYHPTGMSIISDSQNSTTEGKAMGIFGFCGMIGIALSPVIVGGVTELFGWRVALATIALLGLIVIGVVTLALDQPEIDSTGNSIDSTDVPIEYDPGPVESSPGSLTRQLSEKALDLLSVPLSVSLFLLLIAHIVVSMQVRSVQTFTTAFIFTQTNEATTIANAAFFFTLIGGSVASLWAGGLADRFDRNGLGVVLSLFTAALLVATYVFPPGSLPQLLLFPWFFVLGFLIYSTSPVKNALASAYATDEYSGSLFGLLQTATALGSAGGPALFGFLASRHGLRVAFPAISGVCITLAIVFFLLGRIGSDSE
jgi:MFS transporter, FSR family, fosmidomycin resistance protein